MILLKNIIPSGLARAEDDLDDEGVDVEGEDLEQETSVTGDEEAADKTGPGASPDADTTILFTAPLGSSNLGMQLSANHLTRLQSN